MPGNEIINIQVGSCGNYLGTAFLESILKDHWLNNDGIFSIPSQPWKYDYWYSDYYSKTSYRLNKINSYFYERNRGLLTYGYIRQNTEQKYKHLFIPNEVKEVCKYYIGSNSFNSNKYTPRSILIDLEPTTIDEIKSSNIGHIFNPNNFIVDNSASHANNNWSIGYFTEGKQLIDRIMDNIRFEVENCDYLQGFQLCHSIGGGTGSGLGSLIMEKLKDEYPDKMKCNFTVFPSPKVSDVVVEPYNAIFTLDKILKFCHTNFVIDNEALYSLSHNVLKQNEPKYSYLNWITSMAMNGATSSLRFDCYMKWNPDLRKLNMNMIPFPRLKFLLLSQSPLFRKGEGDKIKINYLEATSQMWSSRNFLSNLKSEDGKYLSACCIYRGYRGKISWDDEVARMQGRMADDFVTWIPNNIKSTLIGIPIGSTQLASTFVANTTATKCVFQRISNQFRKMYKRKAFLHWYKPQGMNELNFEESHENICDLITEYQDKQDAVVDLDYDYDEDEEEEEETEDDGDDQTQKLNVI